MKTVLKWIFRVLSVLLLAFGVLSAVKFGPLVKAASSVVKLDEDFYYMEYKGDDGYSEFLKRGGGRNPAELANYITSFLSNGFSGSFGCSALTGRTPEGTVLMGRNFDFNSATGMIMHTYPEHGYESITTFNLDFLNFGEGWRPEGFANKYMAIATLFAALDGINGKGLAMADLMAGDSAETHQDTGKPALTTSSAIKYVLTNAATVDEALELLESIDMHSDIGSAHHYAISDASGRSVVVEYVDNRMVVVESPEVANHYLCEQKHNVGLLEGDDRYDRLCKAYDDAGGVWNLDEFTGTVASVSQKEVEGFLGTAWTMVMDLTNPSVTYYSRRNYDKPFTFRLGSE